LLLSFALEYAIRKFEENQDGLELSGTHRHPEYANDANLLVFCENINAMEKDIRAMLDTTAEVGLK
jgi:hypothetical protein